MILIGLGTSSFDISRDIARLAKEVHVATRPKPDLKGRKLENVRNICFHTLVCKMCYGCSFLLIYSYDIVLVLLIIFILFNFLD